MKHPKDNKMNILNTLQKAKKKTWCLKPTLETMAGWPPQVQYLNGIHPQGA